MTAPFILGFEEWLALPDLGLPAIKAKIDTGARTSALHAHDIEEVADGDTPRVRFKVSPMRRRSEIEVSCIGDLIDRRLVISSNGESEWRYVITTRVAIGGHAWPIEVTLTDRSSMTYRMLLGRRAIQPGMLIDATASFHQPRLSYSAYRHLSDRRDHR